MSSARAILRLFGQVVKRGEANCRLHPLIHTLLQLDLVRDVADIKNAKPKLRKWALRDKSIIYPVRVNLRF